MTYDPFSTGPYRVNEHDGELHDVARDRRLPFAVWQPDTRGPHPLVLYSHSSYGEKRQSAGLLAHLASHGYVAAAADHGDRQHAGLDAMIGGRVPDIRALADHILWEPSDAIDRARMGLVGWSFGGWTVLATLEQDERFGSVVAHAPAGGSDPLPGIIPATLTLRWKRDVPALLLGAELDRFNPWKSVAELYGRAPSAKRMFVLRGADHGHFADVFESDLPCPPEAAHHFTRGLTLAHLDATLNGDAEARRFLEGDVVAALRERGVDAFAYPER